MIQNPIRVLRKFHSTRSRHCMSAASIAILGLAIFAPFLHAEDAPKKPPTMQEVLAASTASDWRIPEPANTLYLQLASGRVVIELAPAFAPRHVANILALVRAHYFDGLTINRVQDDFVTQWGDANAGEANARSLGAVSGSLPAEYSRSASGLAFTPLPDRDIYAPHTGFSEGFPAARDNSDGQAWLTHCYGMLGVGRDNPPDTGNGAELYVVIGQAPRQLDRNIALVGRVLQGMDLLAALPRGSGPLGFYEKPEQRIRIESLRVAVDVAESERSHIETLRTDTPTFTKLVESRRNRIDDWYVVPAGKIDVCSVPLPVRERLVQKDAAL